MLLTLAIILYLLPIAYQILMFEEEVDSYIEIIGWPVFMAFEIVLEIDDIYGISERIKSIFKK